MVEFTDSQGRFRRILMAGKSGIGHYPLLAVSGAMLMGVLLWGGFNWSLEITNTEQFCISCHEMRRNVYVELKKTVHFQNRTGVRATCPDCHVPKEWIYKVIRKVRATGELYHWMIGTVSTTEKFEARRPVLASHVWQSMKETDSRECRNCHKNSSMKLMVQTPRAAKMHEYAAKWRKTCIECHQGIAHSLPDGHNDGEITEELHERIDAEKIDCRECHNDIAGTKAGEDGWAKE